MKNIIYLLLLLLFIILSSVNAQDSLSKDEDARLKFLTIEKQDYFPQKETEWLLDSAYNYLSDPELIWRPSKITRITERTSAGLPLTFEELWYDSQTEEYFVKYREVWEYPNQNNKNIFTKYYYNLDFELGLFHPNHRSYYNNDENGLIISSSEEFYDDIWIGEKEITFESESESYIEKYYRNNENEEWDLHWKGHVFNEEINSRITSYFLEKEFRGLDTVRISYRYYNTEGQTYLSEGYIKDNDNSWYKSYKINFKYDNNGNQSQYNSYSYIDNEWVHTDSTIMEYDNNNFLNSETHLSWKSNSYWRFKDKVEYINDSLGNVLTEKRFDDVEDSIWLESQKHEFIYNENNQIINKVKSSFYSDIGSYRNRVKWTWKYDNSLLLSYDIYSWNIDDSSWFHREVQTTDYDDQARKIFFIKERRDSTNQYWVPDYKTEEEYFDSEAQIIRSGVYFDYNVNASWDSTSKGLTYWNKHITKTNELPINTFKLYPNPSSDYIIVESDVYYSHHTSYEIIGIQGRIIKSGNLPLDGMINIKQLTNGQYFVKIYNHEGKALTLSFVKN